MSERRVEDARRFGSGIASHNRAVRFPDVPGFFADRRMRGFSVTENHREIGARTLEQPWVTQTAFWHNDASGTPPERDLVFCWYVRKFHYNTIIVV